MTRLAEKTDDTLAYERFGRREHSLPRTLLLWMRSPKRLLVDADGVFVLNLRHMKNLHEWLGERIEEAEKK